MLQKGHTTKVGDECLDLLLASNLGLLQRSVLVEYQNDLQQPHVTHGLPRVRHDLFQKAVDEVPKVRHLSCLRVSSGHTLLYQRVDE